MSISWEEFAKSLAEQIEDQLALSEVLKGWEIISSDYLVGKDVLCAFSGGKPEVLRVAGNYMGLIIIQEREGLIFTSQVCELLGFIFDPPPGLSEVVKTEAFTELDNYSEPILALSFLSPAGELLCAGIAVDLLRRMSDSLEVA